MGETTYAPENPEACALFESCDKVFGQIPEDVIQDLFGDHVEFTITAKGVQVEDYTDHD